jgi:S-adenosylmethionine:tRNA ribosyltransferase-isomerase
MSHPSTIHIDEYDYPLADERIAKFPLKNRADSKLLYFDGHTSCEKKFIDLPELLPKNSFLIFNETKVVRARLLFKKSTGATIEIFCLEPIEPVNDFQLAFQKTSGVVWKCLVGNVKRWKTGLLSKLIRINGEEITLFAEKITDLSDAFLIRLTWQPEEISFHEIINLSGLVPLPPYLNREAQPDDTIRYQTVYAKYDGSVAAPTAGLHFTDELLNQLSAKGIENEKVTLHVGAGTFKPVSSATLAEHEMHVEKMVVPLSALRHLQKKLNQPVIPVGTTSMRTLESLFWMAVKLHQGDESMTVEQWDPYQLKVDEDFTSVKALNTLTDFLEKNQLEALHGQTRLMIAPGYQFRFANGLITNFHQPKSTLLLLVSALIGDSWKTAYNFALEQGFRFLSYGDSCLFLPLASQPKEIQFMSDLQKSEITGIVLSGGTSRRMGKEKGLCHFRGKALITYAIYTLKPLCGTLIISANNKIDQYELLEYPVISDEIPETGHIGGLYSCLKQSDADINLLISCDTPFVTTEVYQELLKYIGEYQAVVPIHEDGFLEPITAIYHRSCLPVILQQIEKGEYKMMDLLARLNTKFVHFDTNLSDSKPSPFHNLNSPEDLLSC